MLLTSSIRRCTHSWAPDSRAHETWQCASSAKLERPVGHTILKTEAMHGADVHLGHPNQEWRIIWRDRS